MANLNTHINISANTITTVGKIGYSAGASVTQTTGRGYGVTLNALSGDITLVSATMAAGEVNYFTINNNDYVSTTDMVLVEVLNNIGTYIIGAYPSPILSRTINIWLRALDAVSSPETPTIRFMILKGANS